MLEATDLGCATDCSIRLHLVSEYSGWPYMQLKYLTRHRIDSEPKEVWDEIVRKLRRKHPPLKFR